MRQVGIEEIEVLKALKKEEVHYMSTSSNLDNRYRWAPKMEQLHHQVTTQMPCMETKFKWCVSLSKSVIM